jgi:hypothetical protein
MIGARAYGTDTAIASEGHFPRYVGHRHMSRSRGSDLYRGSADHPVLSRESIDAEAEVAATLGGYLRLWSKGDQARWSRQVANCLLLPTSGVDCLGIEPAL